MPHMPHASTPNDYNKFPGHLATLKSIKPTHISHAHCFLQKEKKQFFPLPVFILLPSPPVLQALAL
jgi:hypothetical protein